MMHQPLQKEQKEPQLRLGTHGHQKSNQRRSESMLTALKIICKVIYAMLPIVWYVAYYLYEHKHIEKLEKSVAILTIALFIQGIISCFVYVTL